MIEDLDLTSVAARSKAHASERAERTDGVIASTSLPSGRTAVRGKIVGRAAGRRGEQHAVADQFLQPYRALR